MVSPGLQATYGWPGASPLAPLQASVPPSGGLGRVLGQAYGGGGWQGGTAGDQHGGLGPVAHLTYKD
jgi:hypothetical protein